MSRIEPSKCPVERPASFPRDIAAASNDVDLNQLPGEANGLNAPEAGLPREDRSCLLILSLDS